MVASNVHGIIRAYYGSVPNLPAVPFPQPKIWEYIVPAGASYAVLRRFTTFLGQSSGPSKLDVSLWRVSAAGVATKLVFAYDSTQSALWTDTPYNLVLRPGEGVQAAVTNIDTVARTFGLNAYLEQVGGAVPGVIAHDTFQGAAGSDLAAHVANTGESWTIANGGWQIGANGTVAPTSAGSSNHALIAGSRGDVTVRATVVTGGNGPATLFGQWVDINNRYAAGLYTGSTPYAYVEYKIGGAGVQIRNTAFAPVKGQTYKLEFRVIGTSLVLLVDGVIQAIGQAPTLLTGSAQGLYCDPLIGGNPTFSDFSVSQP